MGMGYVNGEPAPAPELVELWLVLELLLLGLENELNEYPSPPTFILELGSGANVLVVEFESAGDDEREREKFEFESCVFRLELPILLLLLLLLLFEPL